MCAGPYSFPWLSHCVVKGKKIWKRKKKEKAKEFPLTIRRRDRICCNCNSRGNCHKSSVTVLERQFCSPWKGRIWKSDFFPPPRFSSLLSQLPQLESLGKSAAENSTLLKMIKTCGWKASKTQGRIFSKVPFTDLIAVRNASTQLLVAVCSQPSCKGLLSLLPFNIWVHNLNYGSSGSAHQLLQCCVCCHVLHVGGGWPNAHLQLTLQKQTTIPFPAETFSSSRC